MTCLGYNQSNPRSLQNNTVRKLMLFTSHQLTVLVTRSLGQLIMLRT